MATASVLEDARLALLRLHKELLVAERTDWERVHGEVSSGQLLQLLISDEQFAWLHSISELIVRIDETLEADEPATNEALGALLTEVRVLTTPSEDGSDYQRKYFSALQREPSVVLAHREVRRLLPRAERAGPDVTRSAEANDLTARESGETVLAEAMIDETLEESFPASDPPSWTLGREQEHVDTPQTNQCEGDRSDTNEPSIESQAS